MTPSEAREHIEMVERIVAASSRKLEVGGEFFVVWGIAGAALGVIVTLVAAHRLPVIVMWADVVLLAAALAFTIVRARAYRKYGRGISLLQREFLNVLWLGIAMASLTQIAGFNIFPTIAQIAMWNVVEALVLFYIGMHGNRRALIGGIILVLSIAIANFVPPYAGYILSAGVLFGYGGFGAADLLASD